MRYPKDEWDSSAAKSHCSSKDGSFHKSAEKIELTPEKTRASKFTCECLDCGNVFKSSKHCKDIKCPKCGGKARRAGRPGPGKSAEEKGVILYSVHGDVKKAPEDAKWSANTELKRATNNPMKLIKMHTWVDTSDPDFDPDERRWYKLPHHKGDSKQAVVWNGVKAAMSVLLGARGGVKIPTKDKKGVYAHLARHYKQFGKDVPEMKEYSRDELVDIFGKELVPSKNKVNQEALEGLKEQLEQVKNDDRILTGKNRTIVGNAVEELTKTISILQGLLKASQPAEDSEGKLKGREEEARKPVINTVRVRALQKIAGQVDDLLRNVKKDLKN